MDTVKAVGKWVKGIYFNADHLIRTAYWLKKLDPNADLASIIASITHDIERAFPKNRRPPSSEFSGAKWDDKEYNLWHGKRSARFVEKFLKKQGATEEIVSKVKHLIVYHEIGGDRETTLLKDADSLSFLEINVPLFISRINVRVSTSRIPRKLAKQEVKEKFNYMFNRISSKKAKSLARPFYKKALAKLASV